MTTVPHANYIQWNNATLDDLQPRARLYRFDGMFGYVARIGSNDDYAVYQGNADWTLDTIADYGTKILEEEARGLFPVCLEAGLNYRY
ncbi:hypothetical protein VF14_08930 [Nostoc linckia z18]|uniref:Uncharacterized protein n=2 Tax=Nostoc linckia TaxID=92942 RepID=A0A9Q5ZEA0_NOSLI|nr:hypothetical protein [Nostoc linckia]PHK42566.1 hypothetical protein VF12_02575 [Nostoc linckia z15]PHK44542.1 hypothetical protein VF13_21280 [Nostoc linckia z16]PHJ59586.1 hypothetical protein VF02_24555 [Nostoc linckia z1]PHJ65136.1 hypothetical protein VF05_21595 [Nostoc linckia z3]PHJ69591.1 hypothetical protein VF03_23635 [Nostoc linckia z2]